MVYVFVCVYVCVRVYMYMCALSDVYVCIHVCLFSSCTIHNTTTSHIHINTLQTIQTIQTLQCLPAGVCVSLDHHSVLLVQGGGIDVLLHCHRGGGECA